MPKRKEPELDPKEQFKRFQEAAKELEVEEAQASKAFGKVAKPAAGRSRPSGKRASS